MCGDRQGKKGLSLVSIVFLLVPAVTTTSCDDLQCLNGNPCQSVITCDNLTHAHCVCGGKWTGPRCEHQLRLKTEAVTSSTVTLTVDLMASLTDDRLTAMLTSKETAENFSVKYTLIYWRNSGHNTSASVTSVWSSPDSGKISCVFLHKQTSKRPTLRGLSPRTHYTICIESGSVDTCVLASFTHPFSFLAQISTSLVNTTPSKMMSVWPSNCVTFTTLSQFSGGLVIDLSTLVVTAVVCVAVVIVLILSVLVIMIRRRCPTERLLMDSFRPGCYRLKSSSCCCGDSLDTTSGSSPDSQPDRSLLVNETGSQGKTRKRTGLRCLRYNRKKLASPPSDIPNLFPMLSSPSALNCSESSPLGTRLSQENDSLIQGSAEEEVTTSASDLFFNERGDTVEMPFQSKAAGLCSV